MSEKKIVVKVTRSQKYYILRLPKDVVSFEPLAARVTVLADGRIEIEFIS